MIGIIEAFVVLYLASIATYYVTIAYYLARQKIFPLEWDFWLTVFGLGFLAPFVLVVIFIFDDEFDKGSRKDE